VNIDQSEEFFHRQIPEETLNSYDKDFHLTLTMLLHYLVKYKIQITMFLKHTLIISSFLP